MEKIKGPICHTEVGESNFKETYASPYNNKEHECYECPNCDVCWWGLLEVILEFYFGNKALTIFVVESFAFNVPVIGGNTGCIPEIILEGINGTLFDPYKEGDLEEKMLKFESEILDWRNKSEIIKQSAQKFLDYEGWLNRWEELYKLENLK